MKIKKNAKKSCNFPPNNNNNNNNNNDDDDDNDKLKAPQK